MHAAPAAPRSSHRPRGFTLIESCIVLAVSAITVGALAPGFAALRERHHLEGVAAQLETDIMFTRSLAVARNQTLRLAFAGGQCYVVHTGSSTHCECNSQGQASCAGDAEVLRTVHLEGSSAVTLQSNSRSLAFDAVKGTVTPTATIRAVAGSGASIRSIVNIMGRVRQCSPAQAVPGFADC